MKILQVITLSELGGAQTVLVNLANSLAEDHEVAVVAGEGDGKMWRMLHSRIKKYKCSSLVRSLSPLADIRTVFQFRSIYRDFKPDIVHLHSSKAGFLGRIAFPSSKIVYTVHGFDSILKAYRKYLPLERMMQYFCSSIVGVSRYDEINLKRTGINHNVTCVYNGISEVPKEVDIPLSLPNQYKKTVLSIARLSPQKNHKLFLEVARLLPEYAFVWIGNQSKIEDCPDNVFFLGNISNASRYNRLVDLFILPSNYEGLPMVIIEAMSCAKPIVASDVGGVSEIVHNGKNGYVVDNLASCFAEKIKSLLEDDYLYKQFSDNAYQCYLQQLTVKQMKDGYLKVYREILSKSL